jgi:hypothetical protein
MSRHRTFSKEVGVRRIGEAVNEMPLVEVQYGIVQGASDSGEVLNGHALYAHASLRRQHDLIGKFAIESALAVLSFAPCHMRVTAVRNRRYFTEGLQDDRVLELADIRIAAAPAPTLGSRR